MNERGGPGESLDRPQEARGRYDACERCGYSCSAHSRYARMRFPRRPVCERAVHRCFGCNEWASAFGLGRCARCYARELAGKREERASIRARNQSRRDERHAIARGRDLLREISRMVQI